MKDICKDKDFSTVSFFEVPPILEPEDLKDFSFERDLGKPGSFPFTRGPYETMYRGRLWTMRQFSGFGTPRDTNKRFKYLLEHGQTGLSVAFDLPTLYGYDSDADFSKGEVGKCGVAIDTLADMEILFDGIDLEKITTSMTINCTSPMIFAMYLAVAEKKGCDLKKISGTIQNDILKEYIAQKEFIYPPKPSMKLIIDEIEFCTKYIPKWNTISISGYHIREAGSTAIQELAFTLRNGIEYVEWATEAGLNVDDFAPRLSFFFNAHNDFFEEIAKYRAARRLWAKTMKERFKAKKPESLRLRFHTQTAGCTLTAQQPYNNIIRVAIQALAAVLGGTQSLHTNSMDETYALPTEEAVTIALRTQQILAHESGVANVIDPLGGSYYIEWLTNRMEEGAKDYFKKIDEMGGMVEAIEKGFPQKEIMESAYKYQKALDEKRKYIVGVNCFVAEKEEEIPILIIDERVEKEQIAFLKKVKKERKNGEVKKSLEKLKKSAEKGENTMPLILDCVKAYATIGEITDALKEVYGTYQETPYF